MASADNLPVVRPDELLQFWMTVRERDRSKGHAFVGWEPGAEFRNALRRRGFNRQLTRVLLIVRSATAIALTAGNVADYVETKYVFAPTYRRLSRVHWDKDDNPEVLAFIVDVSTNNDRSPATMLRDRRDQRLLSDDGSPIRDHKFWQEVRHYMPVPFRPAIVGDEEFAANVHPAIEACLLNWYWS